MKKSLFILILVILTVTCCIIALIGCEKNSSDWETGKPKAEVYISELKDYISLFNNGKGLSNEQKIASYQFENDITAFSYDKKKSYEDNIAAINEIFMTTYNNIANGFKTPYDENANLDNCLNANGTIHYNGLLASMVLNDNVTKEQREVLSSSIASMGGCITSYSAGAVVAENDKTYYGLAVYSTDELNKILNLEDNNLKERMLNVKSVSDIYRSSVITFTMDKEVVITNHYTQLGADYLNATDSTKNYVVDQEYYKFGRFEVSTTPLSETNEYNLNVTFEDNTTADFYLNSSTKLVSRRDYIFDIIPYAVFDESKSTGGGSDYVGDTLTMNEGVTKYDVRYGNKKMAVDPTKPDEEESVRQNRQTMTIYAPAQKDIDAHKASGNGIILNIHGGSWTSGDKADCEAACINYANNGYFAVTINHTYGARSYTDGSVVTFASILDEINQAMAKVKEYSDNNEWNITKCATTGYSSGSHLATLYAYSLGNEPDAPIPVVCTFSLVGPMSFYPDCWADVAPFGPQVAILALNDANIFIADETTLAGLEAGTIDRANLNPYDYTIYTKEVYDEKIGSISPASYAAKGDAVPTLLGEALLDPMLVSGANGFVMEEALTKAGIEHRVIIFPNSNHLGSGNMECGNVYRKLSWEMIKKYFGY